MPRKDHAMSASWAALKGRVSAAMLLMALVSSAGPLSARPIRTNTPGTGIFIGSGLLGQLIARRESAPGESLEDLVCLTEYRYAPATHWVLSAAVPYVLERRLDRAALGSESTSGLGDVKLAAKYRFFRELGPWFDRHAAFELGIKLPTGESDESVNLALPIERRRRLQPGTGSIDYILSLIYQVGRRRFVYGGDLAYRLNTEGDSDFRFGDELRLDVDLEYILFPRQYKTPGKELFVLLETALVRKDTDEHRGVSIPATRRTEILMAPGVQYIATEQLLVSFSLQLPVYSDAGDHALESDWDALVELRFAF